MVLCAVPLQRHPRDHHRDHEWQQRRRGREPGPHQGDHHERQHQLSGDEAAGCQQSQVGVVGADLDAEPRIVGRQLGQPAEADAGERVVPGLVQGELRDASAQPQAVRDAHVAAGCGQEPTSDQRPDQEHSGQATQGDHRDLERRVAQPASKNQHRRRSTRRTAGRRGEPDRTTPYPQRAITGIVHHQDAPSGSHAHDTAATAPNSNPGIPGCWHSRRTRGPRNGPRCRADAPAWARCRRTPGHQQELEVPGREVAGQCSRPAARRTTGRGPRLP